MVWWSYQDYLAEMDKLSGKLITAGEGLHWLNFYTDFPLVNALPPLTGHLFVILNSGGQHASREDHCAEKPKPAA